MAVKVVTIGIAVFCCLLPAIAEQSSEERAAKAAVDKCQQQMKLSEDKMKDLREHHMILTDEKNDEVGRCFIECMMQEFKLVKENGEMNVDEVMNNSKDMFQSLKESGKNIDEASVRRSMEGCDNKGKGGDGKCSASYQMWKCLHDKIQEVMNM